MDYLKKYISFNLFAFYGYFALGRFLYYLYTGYSSRYGLCFAWGGVIGIIRIMMESPYFLLGFLCEFVILFILSKIFKKKPGLNIQNKVYDVLFRLGFMSAFVPLTGLAIFIFIMFICATNTLFSLWQIIIFAILLFDIQIRCIFFRKYFVKNS